MPKVFLAALFLLPLFASPSGCQEKHTLGVSFENPDGSRSPQIDAEVVRTPSSRSMGLMYRRELAPEAGMFFIFPESAKRSFWMKNTYVELDIIYLDDEYRVVSISERAVPLSTSPRPSEGPARYVLEVNGGKANEWGITTGSRATFDAPLPAPE